MKLKLALLALAMLGGCESLRPNPGLGWSYQAKKIDADTFHISARESRFASTAEAEELFRIAATRLAESEHCRNYQVLSYSRSLSTAIFDAGIPIVEGDIRCQR